MKSRITIAMLLVAHCLCAQNNPSAPQAGNPPKQKSQIGIGFRFGYNFANISDASSINNKTRSGFVVGIVKAPPIRGVMSYRTEIDFSHQGYDYKTNTTTGSVNLDYLIMPHLMGINIGKVAQIQIGGQVALLLNAKADSTNQNSTGNPYGKIMDAYNRFDYGAAGGLEFYPFKGLLIGGRYNISFGDLYKDPSSYSTSFSQPPSFIPKVNVRNNVVQFYVGYRF